ncbi:mce, Mce5A domain protein [Mycobacteroides abscessus subsp. bolletii 1513]|uniref:Mce, Mce5A domain protein n=1 Tax=Mycobacteroides abscessus subsp. bolletii 1513 TaxID=1299321 RepID=X8E1I5_9MYCO|nr:mce, Mce5A domain protein [Mycobacteroides abscessus subsp. bolletii 1513]
MAAESVAARSRDGRSRSARTTPTTAPTDPRRAGSPGARDGGGAPIAPASFGGTVGPVGSQVERAQLSVITDKPASSATQLLLGPVVRGTTVSLAKEGSR